MNHERRTWPAVTIAETCRILTEPGAPFEMETIDVCGRPTRVYKNAHRDLRAIFDASRAWNDRTFIVYQDERVSYRAHYRAASALAWRLVEDYGVQKGDRVAIAMRNFPEWPIAFWATTAIGNADYGDSAFNSFYGSIALVNSFPVRMAWAPAYPVN